MSLDRRAFLGLVRRAEASDAWRPVRLCPPGLAAAIQEQTLPDATFTLRCTMSGGTESTSTAVWGFQLRDGRIGSVALETPHSLLVGDRPPNPTPGRETALQAPRRALPAQTVEQGSLW